MIAKHNQPVAETMAQIIDEKGLRQNAVAANAGYTKQAMNDMLNGRRIIKASDVPRIAEALGVTPNELYRYNTTQTA